jgi:hypothetical protein
MAKYDNLVNKNVMLKKEMDTLKRNAKGKTCADKELIGFFFIKNIIIIKRDWKLKKKRIGWQISSLRKKNN